MPMLGLGRLLALLLLAQGLVSLPQGLPLALPQGRLLLQVLVLLLVVVLLQVLVLVQGWLLTVFYLSLP